MICCPNCGGNYNRKLSDYLFKNLQNLFSIVVRKAQRFLIRFQKQN